MYVVLVYAPNNCYTQVKELHEVEDVYVTDYGWKFKDKQYKLGESRRCEWGCRYGPITVIESTHIQGLNKLVSASREATSVPSCCGD
jgi:hypothetical protein